MRFWDTSALLPLFVSESGSDRARRWIQEDPTVIVWAFVTFDDRQATAAAREGFPVPGPGD